MRRIDIAKRAGKNLRQAKGRTLLTSLAIAVGAFTLTMSLAAGEGARNYADNLLKNNIDPKSLFIVKDKSIFESGGQTGIREYSDDVGAANRPGATIKMLMQSDVDELAKRDDLKDVTPIYQFAPKFLEIEGVDKKFIAPTDYYDPMTASEAKTGELPGVGGQIKNDEVVIPEDFMSKIGVSDEAILGKKVTFTMVQLSAKQPTQAELMQAYASGGEAEVEALVKPKEKKFTYTVRAVVKKSAMSLANNPQLRVSPESARELSEFMNANSGKSLRYSGATAVVKDGKNPDDIKKQLQDEKGYGVQTAKDAQNLLFTFVNILQGIVAGFGLLALLASIFGIINTQYISVLERTSQIGLMKALGMRSSDVGKLFRYEAAWIGFIGGVLGALLAIGVGVALNPWITESLGLGEFSLLVFVWWQIAILIVALVIVGIVAGWFPSRKAAKLDPIEALRTE